MNPAPQMPHFVSPENRYCGRFATPMGNPRTGGRDGDPAKTGGMLTPGSTADGG
jgi:hypothetical protein